MTPSDFAQVQLSIADALARPEAEGRSWGVRDGSPPTPSPGPPSFGPKAEASGKSPWR
jgi:hypothetical protein